MSYSIFENIVTNGISGVGGVGILSGQWSLTNNPIGNNDITNLYFVTGISGILQNQNTTISNNLQTTGSNLYNLINGLSGTIPSNTFKITGSNNLSNVNLSGAGSVAIYSTPAWVVISGTAAGGGEINTASNLGSGSGLFSQKVGVDLQFKSLSVDNNFTLTGSSTQLGLSFIGSYLFLNQTGQFGSSGNLFATGSNLSNQIIGLSGTLIGTGNGLQNQITNNFLNTLNLTGYQLSSGYKEFHSGIKVFVTNAGTEYQVVIISGASGLFKDAAGSNGNYSIDFFNRFLFDNTSTKVIDYQNKILSGNWTTNSSFVNANSIVNQGYLTGISGIINSKITGRQTIWVPAGGMTASIVSGATFTQVSLGLNRIDINTLDFPRTNIYSAQFNVAMPKSWDVGPVTSQFIWSQSGFTGSTVWRLQGQAVSDLDSLNVDYSGGVQITDTATGDYTQWISAETPSLSISGSPSVGDVVYFRVSRLSTDPNDTISGSMKLIGTKLFYNVTGGSDN